MTAPDPATEAAAIAEAEAAAAERLERDPTKTWITMYHPDLPDQPRSVVTAEAFNMLWASRGWLRLTDEQAAQSEVLGRTVTGDLSPEDAEALRLAQGLDPQAVTVEAPALAVEVPNDVPPNDDSTDTATAAASKKTRTTTADDVKE